MLQNLTDRAGWRVPIVSPSAPRGAPGVKITRLLRANAAKGGKTPNRIVPGPSLWHRQEIKRRLKQQHQNTQPRAQLVKADGSDRLGPNPCHGAPSRNCRMSAAMSWDRVPRG